MTDSFLKSCQNGACSHYFQVTKLISFQPQSVLSRLFLPVQVEKLGSGTHFVFWVRSVKKLSCVFMSASLKYCSWK